ncbi:MAG: alcohol dehydrogenase catalytic domain-containing protein [Synergistetes bacterium]|nr:alcohol dehydrogenase catalytic domain-containing protein [Synergistota bacterium]MDW8191702.1 alcohol dehydrogenase catalytic domain-containing protein [Synergistota bacterium]
MRALVYEGPNDVKVEDIPIPKLKEGEALIRVAYAGICGSDLMISAGKHPRARPPLVLGHEFCGEVVDVYDDEDRHWIGKRVAVEPLISCGKCRPCLEGNYHVCERLGFYGIDAPGGMAEYVAVSTNRLYDVGELSFEDAAIVEPLAVAIHAVRRSNFKIGESSVILGGGAIGNLLAQVLISSGASEVIISEVSSYRRDYLKKLPVRVVSPEDGILKENMADVVFEAAGVPETVEQALNIARVRGSIVQLGLPKAPVPSNLVKLAFKEITWIGCRVYNKWDYLASINLLRQGKINKEALITHVLPLEEGAGGIKMLKDGIGIKILLKP